MEGVSGTWRNLTDNVNLMANNLTEQVRSIAHVTTAVANGDLTRKITTEARGEILELRDTINTMVDQLSSFANEVTRVSREVGVEGRLGGQARVEGVSGTWRDLTDNVNLMATNLTEQVRSIAEVTTAVAQGDLTRKITIEAKGEIQKLTNTINTMVDQLNSFAAEVTRVAREVGTDGVLGGQARVEGVAGTWRELTDNVNLMATNLTDQVRGIVEVVTAVAKGNLKKKLTVVARGEIAALAGTINDMIDTLAIFADQVTDVAREVGIEGKLGGQANVPGAEGTWKDLTDNVNQLAANLTSQVRAIGEVATAVTKGDLSRTITIEASGEVEELKNNVNTMIKNLLTTTKVNEEQDWLKTNLTRFTKIMQGQRDLKNVTDMILSELAQVINAQHGVFYMTEKESDVQQLKLLSSYAFRERKNISDTFKPGEGLIGQCIFEKQRILLTQVPDGYIHIGSGLGEAKPLNIIVVPIIFEQEVLAVLELASFNPFTEIQLSFIDQLAESMGIVLNTMIATMRTEELLKDSQSMAEELESQQDKLQETNKELEKKASELEERNSEIENKNIEVEKSREELKDKAEQLEITSKYKSEFLTNMSHELRTPLNSIMLLSDLLAKNKDLKDKDVEYAETIKASGNELLNLINDILDLSKIEAGAATIEISQQKLSDIVDSLKKTYKQTAEEKNLKYSSRIDPSLPDSIVTDEKRLLQILKNLLSNAFKFTEKGSVTLNIARAVEGWSRDNVYLNNAGFVAAFSVTDTGIGIKKEKQKLIFEAFQQEDGGISRKYGGTGLGLSICREIAKLLNGELILESSIPGEGSTFTFFLPQDIDGSVIEITDKKEDVQEPDLKQTRSELQVEKEKQLRDEQAEDIEDDRNRIKAGDPVILIIEDDAKFAGLLLDMVHEKGYKGLVSKFGESGIKLARKFLPDAITLDINLPGMNGWAVLDYIKRDIKLRHIPVHVISIEEDKLRAFKNGAIGILTKPADLNEIIDVLDTLIEFKSRKKSLLIIEDDEKQQKAIKELLKGEEIKIDLAGTGKQAVQNIKKGSYDCIILDLGLPDMDGFELLEKVKKEYLETTPVIIYTAKELTKKEETKLRQLARTIIIKGTASPERLLDEATLFLHQVETNMSDKKREMIIKSRQFDPELINRKILVIDDDTRNIFALTSILEEQKMKVAYAETGKEGIDLLKETKDIDLILMDLMMPEMDGYEAIKIIRKLPDYKSIPIIAVTAKAMKGDREKCIDAGASDYISKPVDFEQLLSLLRVWISNK